MQNQCVYVCKVRVPEFVAGTMVPLATCTFLEQVLTSVRLAREPVMCDEAPLSGMMADASAWKSIMLSSATVGSLMVCAIRKNVSTDVEAELSVSVDEMSSRAFLRQMSTVWPSF